MGVTLEVCIDSAESARAAKLGGADRLEVCSALAVGGTTPSFGLVEHCVADLEMPVMMMIRPHDGSFVYDQDDLDTMLTDIEVAKSLGVQGVVFGALTRDNTLDVDACRTLLDAAEDLETTFHRAFDVANDPVAAFATIQELGFCRLLTSGQSQSAWDGRELIAQLVQSADCTRIIAGAGVVHGNARKILDATGVTEIHASASTLVDDLAVQGGVTFGANRRATSQDLVRKLKDALA